MKFANTKKFVKTEKVVICIIVYSNYEEKNYSYFSLALVLSIYWSINTKLIKVKTNFLVSVWHEKSIIYVKRQMYC